MKPLGTITMYFQFLDQDTATEVETIMDLAENYYDFVLRLCERACQDETQTDLAYLAAVHAWRLSATGAKDKLLANFGHHARIRAWASPPHEVGFERMFGEDWVLIELLCLKAWASRYEMEADETYWFAPLDRAEEILRQHPDLACFTAVVNTVRSELSFMDRSYERAYDSHNNGIEFAEKFNDKFQTYQLLWTRSSWIKAWDAKKAMELQEEAYKLAKEFAAPQKIAEAMCDMGRISEALGEYDLAIECYQSSLETYGSPGMALYREQMDSPSFCISRVYCELGDGTSGLEWIDSLISLLGQRADENPYVYAQRVEALVLLNRLQEATRQLEICQKLALRSGDEGAMNLCEFPAACLEIVEGDALTALQILEPIFKDFEPTPAAIYNNRFLIALAKAEIAANLQNITAEKSEQWLAKLGRHAREKNLPGIIMIHALLKADYLLARGLKEEAIDTLRDA
ncbi:MAG: hypothetical protein ACXAAR_07570, partial [Candidatus Thorarchaeota archaeon]